MKKLVLGVLIALRPALVFAGYAPTTTEVNLGPIPVDYYTSSATNGNSFFWNCPSGYTVRQCVQYFVQTGPNNYRSQGITGVAVYLGVGGGFYSSTWDSAGNVQSAWVSNFQALANDLKSWGIQRLTVRLNLYGWGETLGPQYSSVTDCTGRSTMKFYPWIPYGFLTSNGFPDCADYNNAYSSANNNTVNFWGWSPFFNLVSNIASTLHSGGVSLEEFVFYDEINVLDFTVQARFIYDPTRSVDVLNSVRYYLSTNGFDPLRATYSAAVANPSVSGFDCSTVWGDSGTLSNLTTLTAALAGPWGLFGNPNGSASNNLWCGGSTTGLVSVPLNYTQPDITDVHAYPCVYLAGNNASCNSYADATTNAAEEYTDLWTFLVYRGLTGNVVVAGETQPDQNCDGYTTAMASQNVNGYRASSLWSNDASRFTFRVWDFPADALHCYQAPTVIANPTGPYAQ